MKSSFADDNLQQLGGAQADRCRRRNRIVAFVPITIAIIGVSVILVGRAPVSEIAASEFLDGVDPVVTGSTELQGKAGM